jgi:hypothetical protein
VYNIGSKMLKIFLCLAVVIVAGKWTAVMSGFVALCKILYISA